MKDGEQLINEFNPSDLKIYGTMKNNCQTSYFKFSLTQFIHGNAANKFVFDKQMKLSDTHTKPKIIDDSYLNKFTFQKPWFLDKKELVHCSKLLVQTVVFRWKMGIFWSGTPRHIYCDKQVIKSSNYGTAFSEKKGACQKYVIKYQIFENIISTH